MFEKKFIIIVILITAIVLTGGIFLATKNKSKDLTAAEPLNSTASAVVGETSYDWGEIGINDGEVEKTFKIKNEGSSPLKLSNVITSCMCTTAQLVLRDLSSPVFGMHSKSNYVLEVPSGAEADLKVVFDPAFHGPSGVGPINRQVVVSTNDSSKPELNFMLTAIVRK